MAEGLLEDSPLPARLLLLGAVWAGLVIGLVEGIGWLIIQRFDRLTGVWTQVLWIAPVVNGLVFLGLGLALMLGLRWLPAHWRSRTAVFSVAAATATNFVGLLLAHRVHTAVLPILILGIAVALTRLYERAPARALRLIRRTMPAVAVVVVAMFMGVQGYYGLRERAEVRALSATDGSLPDVVVVVIDALRADHVGSYGYHRPTTPFLDRLASEGVLFERALAPSPYSLPTHASLLSGLLPYQHGVEWLQFNVFGKSEYPSIAEALRDRGFRTGAFSSNPFWFTREEGFGRGFIRFEDFYHSMADMAYRTVFGKVVERFQPRLGFEEIPARKRAEEGLDRVLDWVGSDTTHPVFAFINLFDVHDPYTPPQPYRSRFSDQEAPGGILNWRIERDELELTPAQLESEIAGYDGALAYVDDQLRRFQAELQARRPGRELLLIVTSDHGEAFGEHGAYLHARSLYREETLVPLIVTGPGVPAGFRTARPVSNSAIPATILDLVFQGQVETFGSPSLSPLWGSDSAVVATWPYPMAEAEQRDWVNPQFRVRHGDIRALLSPAWHYIAYESLPEELFAWADSLDSMNRAAEPGLEDVLAEFRALLTERPRPPNKGPRDGER